MRDRPRIGLLTLLLLGAASAVVADRPVGYLVDGDFDVTHVLEPAPRPGDPRYETGHKIFRATRKMIGSDRWAMTTLDAETGTKALCVISVARLARS